MWSDPHVVPQLVVFHLRGVYFSTSFVPNTVKFLSTFVSKNAIIGSVPFFT